MNILIEFWAILKKTRKEKGFSQEKLSFESGLHRTYISEIERGKKNLTLINIQKIAIALGINISDLFSDLKK
jgi:transcriptional regulator with XRE-family HTH domain